MHYLPNHFVTEKQQAVRKNGEFCSWIKKTFSLGKGPATKSDEFSEKFQTVIDTPTPSFSENLLQIFFMIYMVANMHGGMMAR